MRGEGGFLGARCCLCRALFGVERVLWLCVRASAAAAAWGMGLDGAPPHAHGGGSRAHSGHYGGGGGGGGGGGERRGDALGASGGAGRWQDDGQRDVVYRLGQIGSDLQATAARMSHLSKPHG
jgi:hypothetical protein